MTIWSRWAADTPAASAAAAYAPGSAGAVYTQVGSANDPVLCFGYDDGKMAVSLSLFEVCALEDRERSPEFVLEFVDGFRSYNAVIFVIASFCDASISYAPLWDDLLVMVPTSLVEREDACSILPRDGRWH